MLVILCYFTDIVPNVVCTRACFIVPLQWAVSLIMLYLQQRTKKMLWPLLSLSNCKKESLYSILSFEYALSTTTDKPPLHWHCSHPFWFLCIGPNTIRCSGWIVYQAKVMGECAMQKFCSWLLGQSILIWQVPWWQVWKVDYDEDTRLLFCQDESQVYNLGSFFISASKYHICGFA